MLQQRVDTDCFLLRVRKSVIPIKRKTLAAERREKIEFYFCR